MKFRAMFGDTFIDVEADDEVGAARLAAHKLRESINADSFIVWENEDRTGPTERGGDAGVPAKGGH
jgi:hypothetical protein